MAVVPEYYRGTTEQETRRWPRWGVLVAGMVALILVGVGAARIESGVMLLPLGFCGWAMGGAVAILGLVDWGTARMKRRRMDRVAMIGYFWALLAALVPVAYLAMGERGYLEKAPRDRTTATISDMTTTIETFCVDNGRYPMTADGLEALIRAPAGMEGTWKGPYIQGEVVPVDGWGRNFEYRFPGKGKPVDFEIISAGDDGVPGTSDDIDRMTKP